MTRCGRLLVAAGMASVLVLTPALAGTAQSGAWQARSAEAGQAVARPWMNAAQSPERRAEELVAQMTLAEKITELHGIQDSQHRRYVPGIPRLGIPPLVITNGPAGVGPGDDPQQQPATALSAPISLAASFDAGLARQT
jgi:beta-glucosidase